MVSPHIARVSWRCAISCIPAVIRPHPGDCCNIRVRQFKADVDYANKLRIRPFEQRLNPEKKLNLSLLRLLVVVLESAADYRHLCYQGRTALKKGFEYAFYPLLPNTAWLTNCVLAQDLDISMYKAEVSERRIQFADQARPW